MFTEQIVLTLCTQVPVLAALIWFLVFYVKRQMETQANERELFRATIKDLIETMGKRFDGIDKRLDAIEAEVRK